MNRVKAKVTAISITGLQTRVLLNTYPCADSSLMHVEIAFEEVRFETLFIFTGWSCDSAHYYSCNNYYSC